MKALLHLFVHCFRFIMVALTNVTQRLVIVGFLGALIACTSTVYVEPANNFPFDQTLQFESEMEARQAAHFIPAHVRGDAPSQDVGGYLEPMRLPEPFNATGLQSSTRAYEYHLGYAAARLIRQYYAALHPNGLRIGSDKLVDIVDAAGGNTHIVADINGDWPIEIADIEKRMVFEVVPPGETHQAYGKKKADFHEMFVNRAMIGVPKFALGMGFSGEMGVRFGEKTPPWKLTFETVEPGVIAYRWLVLSVAKLTNEAHIEAYLQDRWHEPTPKEMERLGRSLHLVVENLVQARESLGQIRASKDMPMVPGQTMSDYVRALSLWSAHDSRIARLLPVMREPPAPAKQVGRDKRFIGETIPQSWTEDGRPGNKPFQMHLGSSAHKIIALYYWMRAAERDKVAMNFTSIRDIVRKAEGKPELVLPHEALLRPDIADWNKDSGNIVFEIKPDKRNYLVEAQKIVTTYQAALNRGMVGKNPFTLGVGYAGNLGVKFMGGRHNWNLVWRTATPGVILYTYRPLGLSAEDRAIAAEIRKAEDEGRTVDATTVKRNLEAIKEAVDNNRWIELTEAEMEPYAQHLEEAVDLLVRNRELILDTQDVMTRPIEVTGQIATHLMTAALMQQLRAVKLKLMPPANAPPAVVPRPALPQNDNGVPGPVRAPPPPRMTPTPVPKRKKAA